MEIKGAVAAVPSPKLLPLLHSWASRSKICHGGTPVSAATSFLPVPSPFPVTRRLHDNSPVQASGGWPCGGKSHCLCLRLCSGPHATITSTCFIFVHAVSACNVSRTDFTASTYTPTQSPELGPPWKYSRKMALPELLGGVLLCGFFRGSRDGLVPFHLGATKPNPHVVRLSCLSVGVEARNGPLHSGRRSRKGQFLC